jgi:hypothetical protein
MGTVHMRRSVSSPETHFSREMGCKQMYCVYFMCSNTKQLWVAIPPKVRGCCDSYQVPVSPNDLFPPAFGLSNHEFRGFKDTWLLVWPADIAHLDLSLSLLLWVPDIVGDHDPSILKIINVSKYNHMSIGIFLRLHSKQLPNFLLFFRDFSW